MLRIQILGQFCAPFINESGYIEYNLPIIFKTSLLQRTGTALNELVTCTLYTVGHQLSSHFYTILKKGIYLSIV